MKSNWILLSVGILCLGLTVLWGASCSSPSDATGSGRGTADENIYLSIKGSDTMIHVTTSWAEAYKERNPKTIFSITGGGSGTGVAALLGGTTDICAASRRMKPSEQALAAKAGMDPKEFVVARDGIAVVVNPANPVDSLSLQQIGKIYTGQYENWNQLGGPDHEIVVLSRESTSGTYVFFQEHVLDKQDYRRDARLMPATSAVIQSVSADQWAIGYVGLGYAVDAAEKVKMLAVQADENSPFVSASEETVLSGEYSIARPLHFYTAGEATGTVKEFLDFCLSADGQAIVRQTGYVTVQ